MAYNTKRILTDRDGKPIPQSWDGNDYIPSEIDKRLEAIEDKFGDIQSQQQKIIDRLDEPIDTQVTGSNVEDGIPVQVEKDFIEINLSGSTLEAGKDEVFDVYSNEGEIWTLKRIGYNTSRALGSDGEQRISIYHGEQSAEENFIMNIEGESTQYLRGVIPGRREDRFSGDIMPDNVFEMVESIRDTTVLSDRLPLRIRYRNMSDTEQPSRKFKLFFMVERVNNVD